MLRISTPMRGSGNTSEVCGAKEPLLPESLRELKVELRKAKERLRHKRDVKDTRGMSSSVASDSRASRFRSLC